MNEKLDNICEECRKEDESVSQNLIKHGYKVCDSCHASKTIFPDRSCFCVVGVVVVVVV